MSKPFHMPAEWFCHDATWLSWPHNPETWPDLSIEEIEPVWIEMIRHLVAVEKVHINVLDESMALRVKALLKDAKVTYDDCLLKFHCFPTNDAWARDHSPIFVYDRFLKPQQLITLDWDYNAWGGKYPPFDADNAIPSRVAEALQLQHVMPHFVLEGGSIEVNGEGTLITTESCLLNSNRNPRFSQQQIENILSQFLGAKQILWLGEGIAGDDTDGHIDDITRFVSASSVVTVIEENPKDTNYQALQNNRERLCGMKNEKGEKLQIIDLPMPRAVYAPWGRLPASYANFYIANEIVLVPTFNDVKDRDALGILQECFPQRQVIGIDCQKLIWGLGAIHCVTMQQPSLLTCQ